MKYLKACFLLAGAMIALAYAGYTMHWNNEAVFALRFTEYSGGKAIYHVTDISAVTDYTCDGTNGICVLKFPGKVMLKVEGAAPHYVAELPVTTSIIIVDQGQFLINQ